MRRATKALALIFTVLVAAAHVVAWPAEGQAAGSDPFVALGDSFSSGEGAAAYDTATNKPSNRCHRSLRTWSSVMSTALAETPKPYALHACSGALIAHLTSQNDAEHGNEPAQVSWLSDDTRLVTLTIGGNDALFGGVMGYCAMRNDDEPTCEATWADRVSTAISDLRSALLPNAYASVRRFAKNATVVVMGYPRFFPVHPPATCDTGLGALTYEFVEGDMLWINSVIALLDDAIRTAAVAAGFVYVNVLDAFKGRELCTSSPHLNNALAGPQLTSQQSFHPTPPGYQALARTAQQAFRLKPPTSVRSTATTTSGITLAWDHAGGADGFKVYRKDATGTALQLVQTVTGGSTRVYTDSGLPAATQFLYRVTATSLSGESAPSNELSVSTKSSPVVITTPSPLPEATVGMSYKASLAASGGTKPYSWGIATGSRLPAGLGLNPATGVLSGTPQGPGSQTFTVRAVDTGAVASTGTKEFQVTIVAGAALAISSASPLVPGQVGQFYNRSLAGTGGGQLPYHWSVASGSLPVGLGLADNGVLSGTPTGSGTASFTARVTDSAVPATSVSKPLELVIEAAAPPTPTGLRVTGRSTTRIDLAWNDVVGETRFEIVRQIGSVTSSPIAVPANTTVFGDSGLSPDTTVTYFVRACAGPACSPFPAGVRESTLPTLPSAPTGLTATALSDSDVALAWTDQSTNESSFKTERRLAVSSFWTAVGTAPANVGSFRDSRLAEVTGYCYRVRATNAAGDSAPSGEACVTTLPIAPSNLTATGVGPGAVELRWSDNSAREDMFFERCLDNVYGCGGERVADRNATSYVVWDVTRGRSYCFAVWAWVNGLGESLPSNTACTFVS